MTVSDYIASNFGNTVRIHKTREDALKLLRADAQFLADHGHLESSGQDAKVIKELKAEVDSLTEALAEAQAVIDQNNQEIEALEDLIKGIPQKEMAS